MTKRLGDATNCDKSIVAFRRFFAAPMLSRFFRKPELRGWCLAANRVSKAFTSTPFHA
jgi:hypothetical protein